MIETFCRHVRKDKKDEGGEKFYVLVYLDCKQTSKRLICMCYAHGVSAVASAATEVPSFSGGDTSIGALSSWSSLPEAVVVVVVVVVVVAVGVAEELGLLKVILGAEGELKIVGEGGEFESEAVPGLGRVPAGVSVPPLPICAPPATPPPGAGNSEEGHAEFTWFPSCCLPLGEA